MVSSIIGTYTSIKGQELIDFLVSIGVSKDVARNLLGSLWTLKIWKDDDIYGCYLKCRELPYFNIWDSFVVGETKKVNLHLLGGSAKLTFKMNSSSDGFSTSIETESFGKLSLESKFTDDGCSLTLSSGSKSVTGFWERRVKVEGCYRFDKGENIETFYKTIGRSDLVKNFKDYKVHMHVNGKSYRMSEYVGELGRICNSMELDHEMPFRLPGDKEGCSLKNKAVLTKSGVGKFVIMCKTMCGSLEEWKLTFCRSGMTMMGRDISSGVTCTFHMKRFWEQCGTYKMVRMVGFERFATSVGDMSVQDATSMMTDFSTKLMISEEGNGRMRHQLIRKKLPTDVTFKLNEEFSYMHPVVSETIKVTPKMEDESTLVMTAKTSLGTFLHKMYFSNEFCVMSVSLPVAHMRYKIIFVRCSH